MSESERICDRAAPCAAKSILSRVAIRRLVPSLMGLLIALAPPASMAQNDPPQMFRIAAPSAEGAGFTLAGLVASGLTNPPGGRSCEKGGSCGVPGMIAVVQTVAGADQAAAMVMRGQIEAALLPADAVARAVASAQSSAQPSAAQPSAVQPSAPQPAGTQPAADKPRGGLRTIATISIAPLQVMMRGEAATFAAGVTPPRHAAIAAEEGESPALATRLAAKLLPSAIVDPASLDVAAGVAALSDGKVDWLALLGAAPTPGFVEPIRAGLIRPMSLDGAAMTAQQAGRPWLVQVKIPAGAYADAPEIETVGLPTQLVVSADFPAEQALALARALWQPATIKLLAPARDLKIEQATAGLVAPLHPGAARFYKERGLVEENLLGE